MWRGRRQAEFPWPAPDAGESPDAGDVGLRGRQGRGAHETRREEHEAFMIAQPTSRFSEPTIDLVKNNFGDRVEIREGLDGNASVISTEKAQRLLGWRPRYDWRQ